MANPSVNNVDGTNPGPNSANTPDTVQSPVGNIWKEGVFSLPLTPAAVAANTTVEQLFASTGIGLLPGDFVNVIKPTTQAGLGIVNARVSAADTLAIAYSNNTAASITPSSETYLVQVVRPQPFWTKPAAGFQMDW